MKILKKIAQEFKGVFEGNRCRFANKCELYRKDLLVCNNLLERFPTDEKAYCGRYRSMEEDEEKEKDMLKEYDFSKGVMGKYSKEYEERKK